MSATNHEVRERAAREAYESLGKSPSEKALTTIHCSNGHSLGAVYDTEGGRVFRSVPARRSYGQKDLPSSRHTGTDEGRAWFDWLDAGDDPMVEEEMPSGCACGGYLVSRSLLASQIAQGEKRVIVE